jgi:hypothetical protein
LKYLLPAMTAFLLICMVVGVAFCNPIPWDSLWEGKPIQYLSVIAAEICGLLAGVATLAQIPQTRWSKATIAVSIAQTVSYTIGLFIWTLGYLAGILIYNPINPFFNVSLHPLGLAVLLLPEFIGTALGTIIIKKLIGTSWRTALIAMIDAMLVSFLVGMLIANTVVYFA